MITSFKDYYSTVLTVLKSKDTLHPLYLDEQGGVTDKSENASSMMHLFLLALTHHDLNQSDITKWTLVNKAVAHIVAKETSQKVAELYVKLIHPLASEESSLSLSAFTKILSTTSKWISDQCLQDFFMETVREIKETERELATELKKLDNSLFKSCAQFEPYCGFIASVKLLSKRPKSPEGEMLLAKLRAEGEEVAICFDHQKNVKQLELKLSREKVVAMAQNDLIETLKAKHPHLSEAFDEVHKFCQGVAQYLKVWVIFQKREVMYDELEPVYSLYFDYVAKSDSDNKSLQDVFKTFNMPQALDQDWSKKLLLLIKQAHVLGGFKLQRPSCKKLCEDLDELINPSFELLEAYKKTHKSFFLEYLDYISFLNHSLISDLKEKVDEQTFSKFFNSYRCLSAASVKILGNFEGPLPSKTLPDSSSWLSYMQALSHHLHPSFEKLFDKDTQNATLGIDQAAADMKVRESIIPEAKEVSSQKIEHEAKIFEEILFKEPKKQGLEDFLASIIKDPISFSYDSRVTQWLDNPQEALKQKPYVNYSPAKQHMNVKIHAFSTYVDLFVGSQYCQKGEWENQTTGKIDDLYRLAGLVKFDGKEYKGIFEYTLDRDYKHCYHRFFRIIEATESLSHYLDRPLEADDIEYPTLDKLKKLQNSPKKTLADGSLFLSIDALGKLTFHDTKASMTVSLFKLN